MSNIQLQWINYKMYLIYTKFNCKIHVVAHFGEHQTHDFFQCAFVGLKIYLVTSAKDI